MTEQTPAAPPAMPDSVAHGLDYVVLALMGGVTVLTGAEKMVLASAVVTVLGVAYAVLVASPDLPAPVRALLNALALSHG